MAMASQLFCDVILFFVAKHIFREKHFTLLIQISRKYIINFY